MNQQNFESGDDITSTEPVGLNIRLCDPQWIFPVIQHERSSTGT